ncbi:hypothetical protein BDR26DRAFT_931336 [Obelidium mucronatum]|nr:hypothetical protein BDR26DRAFT_931336 [Obelidium mucronatum]
MDSLEQDLIALKLEILKEAIANDLKNPTKNTSQQPPAIKPLNSRYSINPTLVNALKTSTTIPTELTAFTDRMNSLLDRLEASAVAPNAASSPDKMNTADMIQSITLQNAQLHGLIMANMMANSNNRGGHHRLGQHGMRGDPNLDFGGSPYNFQGDDNFVESSGGLDGIQSRTLLRGPSDMKRYPKPTPPIKKPTRKLRIAIHAILFSIRMTKESRLFRSYSKKVGQVISDAETQFILVFKERKSFFKAIEAVCAITKEGTSLVYKESFANPRRKGVLVQEKVIQIGDCIIEALERISVSLITERLGPTNSILRVFDYLISKDVQYPPTYLWSAESRDLLDAPPYKKNPKKLGQETARILLLYFFAKTILLKVFTHPVDQQIVNKHNPLLETNMVTVSVFLFRGLQLACDHSGDADADEFNAGLPNGDFKSSWISPALVTAIQAWAGRLKDWSIRLYKDLEKGVVPV